MNLLFICVNYNNQKKTINWIDSILSLDCQKDICIVDNNSESSDKMGLSLYISNKDVDAKLIKLPENLGYFRGLNCGLKEYNLENYDYIIIGNNDLVFDVDFCKCLSNLTLPRNTMAISPNIVTGDIHENPRVINKISNFRLFMYRIYYQNYYFSVIIDTVQKMFLSNEKVSRPSHDVSQIIKLGLGACYILTPNYLLLGEYLSEDVFLWGEEAFFSDQLNRGGGCLYYAHTIKVFHDEHSSVSKINSKNKYLMMRDSYFKYKDILRSFN